MKSIPHVLLMAAAMAGSAGATPVVLDDYTSDANFVAGKYTYYEVANWSGRTLVSSVTVSDGTLKIDNVTDSGAPQSFGATAAQMWNAGEALRQVGDAVSVDLTGVAGWRTAGLFIDGDLAGRAYGAEVRWSGFDDDLVVSELRPDHRLPTTVTTKTAPAPYEPVADWAQVAMTMRVTLVSIGETEMDLVAQVFSDAFPTLSVDFSIPGSEAYFGPVAWANADDSNPARVRAEHDNLTFIPAPPADLSGDGDVDDEDLGLFFSAFTGPDLSQGPLTTPAADLSGDGDVDDEDLGLAFGAITGPLGPAPVPEPASLALLALGVVLGSRRC